ncbi:MAG: Uma2 family endonuclease [Isosphaerales bacterium]
MTTATAIASKTRSATTQPPTLDELVERLGGIPLSRILVQPALGSATEADLLEAQRRYGRLYELVDGVLVEKGMGYRESLLAGAFIEALRQFVRPRKLGLVSAPDGTIRVLPGQVRIPDVSFASWGSLPEGKVPVTPIPPLSPDLVVEVLSDSNTPAEMERKRGEYFTSGVRLIWEVDPESRVVAVYTPDGAVALLDASQTLNGGAVLPGFTLNLSELFAELDELA